MSGMPLVQKTLSLEGADPCQFMVLYEDAVAHDAAMEVCERLLAHFGSELAFAFSFWTFRDITTPASAQWAAQAVSRADIILLSLQGREPAPTAVNWLDACARSRTKPDGALAVLVTSPHTGLVIEALLSRMQFIAQRLQMDFLPLGAPVDAGEEAMEPLPGTLNQAREEPSSNHWGLND